MINNTLVIEKHTSDLTGILSIVLLDNWEDTITYLLLASIWILDLENFFNINKSLLGWLWLGLMLLLLLSLHIHCLKLLLLLLLHKSELVWGHNLLLLLLKHGSLDCLLIDHHLLLLVTHHSVLSWFHTHHLVLVLHGLLSIMHALVVIWPSSWLMGSHVVAWASLVVCLSSIYSVVLSLILTSVLHSVHVATHVVLTIVLIHSIWHALSHDVLEEVLLHLLETSVLSLLVELTAWHPVLDGESSSSKWSGVIKSLNGTLGILNLLVENKVLAIGCIWIEVFSLSHLNGDDWTTLGEQLDQLILRDLSWDVFHKEIRFKCLSDCFLNSVALRCNLAVSL